jgi:hypothetical protein
MKNYHIPIMAGCCLLLASCAVIPDYFGEFVDYAKSIGADAIVITGTCNTKNDAVVVVNADALKYDK